MRLYVLQYALREEDGNPIPGYLIVTDDQQYILVDTGFPTMDSGMFVADFVKPEDDVRQQLALMDLRPDDIDILICTHFDPDHSGAHHLFTAAKLIVQRQHYEFVHNEAIDRFESTRPSWDAPGLNYHLVDGDTVIVPGVEVIDTSGHVPGHQSVLVRLPERGPVLLAIDALHHDPELPFEPGDFDMNPKQTAASIEKMKNLIAREGVTLTLFGHNGEQWATVRKAPDCYA